MGKMTRVEIVGKTYSGTQKKVGHGSYKAKRKPTSPFVLRKEREKAAAEFGKSPEFRQAVYGIAPEAE